MPRKAKDKIDEKEKIEVIEDKKTAPKKESAKKKTTTAKKTATTKKYTAEKKTATKNTTAVKETSSSKKNSTKKEENKKEPVKKSSTKRKSTKKVKADVEQPIIQITEYYDLPLKYGNTVVRLLAQTPKTLFVYWEVSDSDIENFKKSYGDDFFIKTKPILVVHNLTLNKTTEVEINDFANCWYLNTEDSDCKYDIELARKFIETSSTSTNAEVKKNYLSIATSNDLQSPNNHILFEKIKEFVVFRNVNNDNIIKKNIKSFKFLKDIYKFYKDMYDEEVLNNPSSQFKF